MGAEPPAAVRLPRLTRGRALAAVAAACALSVLVLRNLPYDATLDCMLPEGGETRQALRLLRETNLAGHVLVALERAGPAAPEGEPGASADRLARKLAPPLVTRVLPGEPNADAASDWTYFVDRIGCLLDERDLAEVRRRIEEPEVRAALRRHSVDLVRPDGAFRAGFMRRDPLGLASIAGARLQRLAAAAGFSARVEGRHFADAGGRRALLVLETPVAVTDADGSRRLLDYLDGALRDLPAGVRADVVAAHRHTVSNERTIRSDVGVTLALASLAIVALFAAAFRDARALLVFAAPMVALLLAGAISGLLMGGLAAVVVGLASVIVGVAVDYGIHVYVAVRNADDPAAGVARIARPLYLGALTTAAAFGVFAVSHVPGHRQLACLSLVCVGLSVLLSRFVLPLFIGGGRRRTALSGAWAARLEAELAARRRWVIGGFAAAGVVGLALAARVTLEADLSRLDGTDRRILESERRALDIWAAGGAARAVVVAEGATYAEAAARADAVYRAAGESPAGADFVSLTSFWPPAGRRSANLARWRAFWRGGEAAPGAAGGTGSAASPRARLRALLQGPVAAELGFAADAFAPFLDGLDGGFDPEAEPAANGILESLKRRFADGRGGRWRAIVLFPDTDAHLSAAQRAAAGVPGVSVVSRRALAAGLSREVAAEVARVSLLGALVVVGVTVLSLRSVRVGCLALLPPAAGVVAMLAALSVLGLPLNVGSLIAGILVLGLSVDYGIFVVHALGTGRFGEGSAVLSITLSAATTVAGAGALLFARHPLLFSIGLALCAGMAVGYLVSVLLVPCLWRGQTSVRSVGK